jgi:hypothetical protein
LDDVLRVFSSFHDVESGREKASLISLHEGPIGLFIPRKRHSNQVVVVTGR